jgi:hypothetical protein
MNRNLLLGALLLTLLAETASWAKSYPMIAGTATPSAKGKVQVGKEKNGNMQVTVKTEHLPKPGKLKPSAKTYVVWFQEQGSEPINQGQLKVGGKLKGKFKTKTRYQNFDVFITPETDLMAKVPSGQTVLTSKVQV